MIKEFTRWFFSVRGSTKLSKAADVFAKVLLVFLFLWYPFIIIFNLLTGEWERALFNFGIGLFFFVFNFMLWMDSFMREKMWDREKKLLNLLTESSKIMSEQEVARNISNDHVVYLCGMIEGIETKQPGIVGEDNLVVVRDIAKAHGVTIDFDKKPAKKKRGRPAKKVDPAVGESIKQ